MRGRRADPAIVLELDRMRGAESGAAGRKSIHAFDDDVLT